MDGLAGRRATHLAGGLVETKGLTELSLRGGLGDVDLVAKHKEGDGLQIVGREQPLLISPIGEIMR